MFACQEAPLWESMPRLFGTKLQHLRLAHNLTQTELARRLQLASPSHISFLESERKSPSLDLVLLIADLFKVTTDYLLRDSISVDAPSSAPDGITMSAEPLRTTLGNRLATLRIQRQLSQTEVATRLTLATPSHISHLEANRKMPSLSLVVKLADLFEVTTDDLLRGSHTYE